MRLTAGPTGTLSYLPEYLERAIAGWPIGRCFLIPENRPTAPANDRHFTECFGQIAKHAPLGHRDYVFIDRSAESGAIRARLEHLNRLCDEVGLPPEQLIYVSQNSKVALARGTRGPQWLFFHHYAVSMARKYAHHGGDYGFSSASERILCLNAKVRPHRLAGAAAARRILRDRLWLTWGGKDDLFTVEKAMAEIREVLPSFESVALEQHLPESSLPNSVGVGGHEDAPLEAAAQCFLHLVTESDYRHYSDRFSEKVLKPIALHRPFIVYGPQGILRRLRELGFRTFGDILDETYDEIENEDARLAAVLASLEALSRRDHRTVIDAASDICRHNQAHLIAGLEQRLFKRFEADLARLLALPEPRT